VADIVVSGTNPFADTANIRWLSMVIKDGGIIDLDVLPTSPTSPRLGRRNAQRIAQTAREAETSSWSP
jgi:hypothetical protein